MLVPQHGIGNEKMELLNPPARAVRYTAEKNLRENQRIVANRFKHIKQLYRAIDDDESAFSSWLTESKSLVATLIQQVA